MKFMYTSFWHAQWDLCLTSLSPSKQVLHSFEEDMALENTILQSSKKEAIRSTSEGSINASFESSNQSA